FCREAVVWKQLKHPNILPILGVSTELFFPSFCLISPWMENGTIMSYLKHNPTFDLLSALRDISAGLCYLHTREPPIIHGDIRGANILITRDLRCCLADFGLALVASDSDMWSTATTYHFNLMGALRWMAPECLNLESKDEYDIVPHPSRDIYAFACTVVEIITRKPPFHTLRQDPAVILSLSKGERPPRPENVWCPDELWDLTTRCWNENPLGRPPATDIHRIISSIGLKCSRLTIPESAIQQPKDLPHSPHYVDSPDILSDSVQRDNCDSTLSTAREGTFKWDIPIEKRAVRKRFGGRVIIPINTWPLWLPEMSEVPRKSLDYIRRATLLFQRTTRLCMRQ
ncbi:kinase-like domain-containing protein, partial [Lentinula boryana]